jgi:hypothetical protein
VNLDTFTQAVLDKYGGSVGANAGAWIDARNAEHKELLGTLKARYEKVASGIAAIEREYKSAALSRPLRAMVWLWLVRDCAARRERRR